MKVSFSKEAISGISIKELTRWQSNVLLQRLNAWLKNYVLWGSLGMMRCTICMYVQNESTHEMASHKRFMTPTGSISLFLACGYSVCGMHKAFCTQLQASHNTPHNSAVTCQRSNHSNNKLSCHLVGTLKLYLQPFLFQIFQNIFPFLLQTYSNLCSWHNYFLQCMKIMMPRLHMLMLRYSIITFSDFLNHMTWTFILPLLFGKDHFVFPSCSGCILCVVFVVLPWVASYVPWIVSARVYHRL